MQTTAMVFLVWEYGLWVPAGELWQKYGACLVWWFALLGWMPKMASETLMVAPKFVFLGPISPLSGQQRWPPKDRRVSLAVARSSPTVSLSTSSKPLSPLPAHWCLTGPMF